MTRAHPKTPPSRTGENRSAFEEALIAAITDGQLPRRTRALPDDAWSAIEAVARAHPEAAIHLITDAYDTYGERLGAVG